MLILFVFLLILMMPSVAYAWGPLTHFYLGHQVLALGASVVPIGIYNLIRKFKNDFLYGNISADIIIGKRFQAFEKSSHNWNVGIKLLKAARTEQRKSFAYGYLTHLAADTVAHNYYIPKFLAMTNLTHSILEVKADSIIDKEYRYMVKNIDKLVQLRNDVFLEKFLERLFLSFKTNKKIFKGVLLLSRFSHIISVINFVDKRLPNGVTAEEIFDFQSKSLVMMLELLRDGEISSVFKKDPMGRVHIKPFNKPI